MLRTRLRTRPIVDALGRYSPFFTSAGVIALGCFASAVRHRSGIVNDLVLENPFFLGQWGESFRPVKNSFLEPLSAVFRNHSPERSGERTLATSLLTDYAADQPGVLADLLMDADEKQFART
jgi:hypothetical protein